MMQLGILLTASDRAAFPEIKYPIILMSKALAKGLIQVLEDTTSVNDLPISSIAIGP
jgi:hypothetical protein